MMFIWCSGDLPAGVLAGHVQLHVQSHDLLLHEPEVVRAFHDNLVVLIFWTLGLNFRRFVDILKSESTECENLCLEWLGL